MRRLPWIILLGVLAGSVVLCGTALAANTWVTGQERNRSDRALRAYLNAIVRSDYDTAYALVCTDETGVDRDAFEKAQREDPVRAFEIGSSSEWSSWIDGHGRHYQVRVTRTAGAETVEDIPTSIGDNVCIEYGDIRPQ